MRHYNVALHEVLRTCSITLLQYAPSIACMRHYMHTMLHIMQNGMQHGMLHVDLHGMQHENDVLCSV